jgi:predicted nucleic acid-binding Zn ribbon protein
MKKENSGALGDLLKKVVSELGKKKLSEEALGKAWRSAVGRKAARHTRLVSLKKANLIVNVDSSSWLFELSLKKRALIKKVSQKARGKKIKDIRLRIGDIKR